MNSLLAKHRPKDSESQAEWEKYWENQTYTLQPMADCIKEMAVDLLRVKPDDFGTANHYAQLAYEAGMKAAFEKVLALMPKGVEK